MVIASKVKSGSQARGTVGLFGLAGAVGRPPLMRKEIPELRRHVEIPTGGSYPAEYFLHDSISRSDFLNFLLETFPFSSHYTQIYGVAHRRWIGFR